MIGSVLIFLDPMVHCVSKKSSNCSQHQFLCNEEGIFFIQKGKSLSNKERRKQKTWTAFQLIYTVICKSH